MSEERIVKVKELTRENFAKYGDYVDLLAPNGVKIGNEPIEFYRDMIQMHLGDGSVLPSFSICKVDNRPAVIDVTEYHSYAMEGNIPLDGDTYMHFAKATPTSEPPLDDFEVFRIPKGTLVVAKPGVWHHAPFAVDTAPVHTLVILPERTYANDCIVVELKKKDQIKII